MEYTESKFKTVHRRFDDYEVRVRHASHLDLCEWLNFKPRGYVYLAYCNTNHYKIGVSVHPNSRIKHFDTIMPVSVNIETSFPCDNPREAEAALHEHFADTRFKGEWFSLDHSAYLLIHRIKRYQNGKFYYASSFGFGEHHAAI